MLKLQLIGKCYPYYNVPQEDNNQAKLWLCYSPSRQATAQPQFGSVCTQKNFKTFFTHSTQLQILSLNGSTVFLVSCSCSLQVTIQLPDVPSWTNPCILQPGPLKAWVEFQLPAENTVSSIIVVSATTHTSTRNFFISILGHCRLSGPKSHYHFHYTSRCVQVMSYMSNLFFCQNPIVLLAYLPTLSSHTHCLIKLFWQFPQLLTTCATLYLVHHHPNSLPRLLKLQVFLAIGLHLCLWLKALSKTTP